MTRGGNISIKNKEQGAVIIHNSFFLIYRTIQHVTKTSKYTRKANKASFTPIHAYIQS